jgi:UDP-GlcNAc:undecaprenyl-phosphate GlcNAc-1-phosphate transferase
MRLAAIFITAFAASLALTPLCRLAALRLGYVARPQHDRWHKKPTALLGGIAIALVTLIGLLGLGVAFEIWPLVVCAGAMFVIGIVDDVLNVKASTKLIAEIAIASVLVFFGYRLGWTQSLTGDALLTLFWIVGITNAFNLLDNMDGLCAGIALIAGASLMVSFGLEAPWAVEAYTTLLLGATAGFLFYNFNPASIFLGDSGSLFIGSSLAFLTLSGPGDAMGTRNVLAIVAGPVFLLLIPIFDTTLVTLSRLWSGRSPSTGGRDHSSHRLVAVGLSERAAVAVLWALAGLSASVGISFGAISTDWSALLAALYLLAMVIFASYLAHVRVYEKVDNAMLQSGRITVFVTDFMFKRRVAEVILDTCLICLAYYGAYRLRFEDDSWQEYFPAFIDSLPVVLAVQLTALFVIGAYRGVWRHFTLSDGMVFAKCVAAGTVASVAVIRLIGHQPSPPAVFIIYAMLFFVMIVGSRASFRVIGEFVDHRRKGGQRVVIYSATDGGDIALREVLSAPDVRYRVVGFVDDDKLSHRSRFHGYSVLGGPDMLPRLIEEGEIDVLVIGRRAMDVEQLNALKAMCREGNVELIWLRIDMQRLTGKTSSTVMHAS